MCGREFPGDELEHNKKKLNKHISIYNRCTTVDIDPANVQHERAKSVTMEAWCVVVLI